MTDDFDKVDRKGDIMDTYATVMRVPQPAADDSILIRPNFHFPREI